MSLCVVVTGGGYVVEATGETYPSCSEFALLSPVQLDLLTYWANVSQALDPTVNGWDIYLAITGAFIAAWAIRLVVRLILNR